jgi:pimeloyl-ACP methyl ester carboxylesterase
MGGGNMTTEPKMEFYKSEKGYQSITRWYNNLLDKFDFEYESKYVDTRFGETHMLVSGPPDAAPLILVQAIAGSAPLWYHQIPYLANHFRVYALDTPGQPGRSAPNPPAVLEGGYSDWLIDVLDGLGIERANFVGVSFAGWVVMRLAIRNPERVERIVMISPTGLVSARFPIGIFLRNVVSKKKDDQALEDDLTTRSFMPTGDTDGREFDRQLARAMALATRHYKLDKSLGILDEERGRPNAVMAARVIRQIFLRDRRAILQQLSTPGLVLFGEHEMLFNSKSAARKINNRMPSLDAVVIPETGHSAMYDQPELVNPLILEFLKQ